MRSLNGKLPTNEKITTFGIKPTNYFCCSSDTIIHIFNNGELATEVWRRFATMAGVKINHSTLQQLILQWWTMKHKNESHTHLTGHSYSHILESMEK